MNILWFTWKDINHPEAGGAELVNEELAKLLVKDGHHVQFVVAGWKGCKSYSERNGFKIDRVGNRYTCYIKAYFHYKKYKNWADVVVDECNTMPFFCKYYVKQPTVFFIQQLAREVWFYQMPIAIAIIGYMIEPIYLRLLNREKTLTFAESTKSDLINLGFDSKRIGILSEAFTIKSAPSPFYWEKQCEPTILFFSAFREMKRPDHVIKAFEIAKETLKNLRLEMVGGGSGPYSDMVVSLIKNSKFSDSIKYHGKVYDAENKKMIMGRAHFICCTSVREGWGIIVSEAGSQGTPAIVYKVNGLKDAVKYGDAGLICERNNPEMMAKKICEAFSQITDYNKLVLNAFETAKNVNVNSTYGVFLQFLKEK
ncbi:MAG: hypothetical protein EoVTN8_397 [Fluviibacter phosphoraccumulans EoVTN8]